MKTIIILVLIVGGQMFTYNSKSGGGAFFLGPSAMSECLKRIPDAEAWFNKINYYALERKSQKVYGVCMSAAIPKGNK